MTDATEVISGAAASFAREIPLVVAFWLQARVSRYFDLALGAALTTAAYVSLCVGQLVVAAPVADLAGIATGALLSLFIGLGATTLFRDRSSDELLLASFAVYSIAIATAALLVGSGSRSLRQSIVPQGSLDIRIVIALLLLSGCYFLLEKSWMGRQLRAVADDLELARAHGIATLPTRAMVSMVAGALAAVTGIFVALDFNVEPHMAWQPLLDALVPVALTSGRSIGTLGVAAAGFSVVREITRSVVGEEWHQGITLALLLVALAIFKLRRSVRG